MTSQIFANIYLNELDRFVKHDLRIKKYLRYGDDFVIFEHDLDKLTEIRENIIGFINQILKLTINIKNDIVIKTKRGIKFLGVEIFPQGRRLKKRNTKRVAARLTLNNAPSYYGLVKNHSPKKLKELNYKILEKIKNERISINDTGV